MQSGGRYYSQIRGLAAKAEGVAFTDNDFGPYVPALRKSEYFGTPPYRRSGLSLDTFWHQAADNYKAEARN